MRMWQQGGRSIFLIVSLMVCGAVTARATSGTWLGATDSYWDKDSNWSGAVRPSGNETATFDGPGNNQTTLSLSQVGQTALSILNLVFTGQECAAYTLGTSSGQRLWFRNAGTLTIDADVVNNQTIAARIQYGNSATSGTTIRLINNSPVAGLFLNGATQFTTATSPNLTMALKCEGVGNITFNNTFQTNGISNFNFNNYSTGTITLAGAGENRINYLYMVSSLATSDNTRLVLNSGTELFIDHGSERYSLWHDSNGVIEGAGTLRFGTGTGEEFAKVYIKAGSTLTIRTPMTSAGGLEMFHSGGGGTLVLDCVNTLSSNLIISATGATISVAKIGNRGSTDSNVGCGQCIRLSGSGSRLIYTGLGETTDRLFEVNASASFDQSGSGDLIFTEDLLVGTGNKTLTLTGSTSGAGKIAGNIGPGASGTTSLVKEGSGLWRLAGANTYTGTTTIKSGTLALTGVTGAITASSKISLEGSALHLENNANSNNVDRLGDAIPLTLNNSTLKFAHSGGAADYSETAGTLTISGLNNKVSASQAAEGFTSTLTLASLTRTGSGTIDFTGVGLGTDNRNRILFTTPPPLVNGYIGAWATINGIGLASYDATLGVIPGPSTNIAARGPDSVIPDDAALNVNISMPGTDGPITIEGAGGSSVFSLSQWTDTPAIVDMVGKVLLTDAVNIAKGGATLSLGLNPGEGTLKRLLTDDGEIILANHSTNGTLTVNAAIADNIGATSITKKGVGKVVLNGAVSVSGNTLIQDGALDVDNVPGVTHALGSLLTVTGGGETPTTLSIGGASEIVNYGEFSNAYQPGDRCVVIITNDFTVQGSDSRTDGHLYVGTGANTAGAIIQSGGAVTASAGIRGTDYLSLGKTGGYGYYRLTGGSLTGGQVVVGGSSPGSALNVGVLDLFDGALTVDSGYLLLGWTKAIGVVNLFGGTYEGGTTGGMGLLLGWTGKSGSSCIFNLLGPEVQMFKGGVIGNKKIDFSYGGTNVLSAVNLNNGELTLYRAHVTTPGTTTHFNFNGGTLKAAASYAGLMQGLTAAVVYPGGAKIDTAGYNVTINQPLLAPIGYGVTEIVLSTAGAGYIGAPAVQLTGGSGIGATAIALVDLEAESLACGQVTNILVTSAGVGYQASDTLVATLLGGGSLTPATLGAVTLAANVSGGLVKSGAGILTLGGACTYSGGTTISGGTLKCGVADALLPGSAVTLGGGTLDLNGLTVSNMVFGAGEVVNGTLFSEFSPAGKNSVGSQSSAATIEALSGIYHVNVTVDGDCDLLMFEGDADLSNVAIQIVDQNQLNRTKSYSIAKVIGTLSGSFGSTNLIDDRWHLYAGSDGVIRLFFSDGLLLLVR